MEARSYTTPRKTLFPPIQVQQADAKLVGNMVPLELNQQITNEVVDMWIGNTGKSVSRSYNGALDVLVGRKC